VDPARKAQVQKRIRAAVQKMRAEGKSPEEIRAALRQMRERARKALMREFQGPGAEKAKRPGARKENPAKAGKEKARKARPAEKAKPAPRAKAPAPGIDPAAAAAREARRARMNAAIEKMRAEGKSPEEVRAGIRQMLMDEAKKELGKQPPRKAPPAERPAPRPLQPRRIEKVERRPLEKKGEAFF